jgi:hypothetical protein
MTYLSAKQALHLLEGDVVILHTADGMLYLCVDTEPESDRMEGAGYYEIWVTDVEPDINISALFTPDGTLKEEIEWSPLPGAESRPWDIGKGIQVVTYIG